MNGFSEISFSPTAHAKTLLAADPDHGNAFVVFRFQCGVGVDIDFARAESVAFENVLGLIA